MLIKGRESPHVKYETTSAGDILEHAVFLSIRLQDDAAFERNYLQLNAYYTDTRCSNFCGSYKSVPNHRHSATIHLHVHSKKKAACFWIPVFLADTIGQLPPELAELSEEALQLQGDALGASVLPQYNGTLCIGLCSYGDDDAE